MSDLSVRHLLRDHQEAQKVLSELESLLDALDSDLAWTAERCATFRRISNFFTHNLCCLVRKEDEILYPSLNGLFPPDFGPLALLRGEHEALCRNFQHLCEVGQSLCQGENSPQALKDFARFGRGAAEVLRDHLYKEKRVLFPMVTRFLSPELDAELLQKMENLRTAKDKPESLKQQS